MIRRLHLENASGNRFEFSPRSGCLISGLSGLGFSQEITYLKYDHFYDRVDQTEPLSEIQGALRFLKGYRGYVEFTEFLRLGEERMKLVYEAEDTAFCFVDVKSLSKTELVAGALTCLIIFQKLSPWLKFQVFTIAVNEDTTGKVYPFLYPYRYTASFEGKIRITNRGVRKAPLFIEMIGAVNNPEVLLRKDDEVVSTLRIYHTSESGEIHVSAVPNDQFIRLVDNGVVTSLYAEQDFSCDNFLFVDPGECEIEFRPGVSSPTRCRITMLEGYLGV